MALEIFKLVGSIFVDNDKANESIQKTDEKAEGLGNKLLKGVGTAAKWGAGIVTAATGMATAVGGAMVSITENTREYRNEMGKLETAYQSAGFETEAATDTYRSLNAVLGDTGQAVEAANHLAKLCDTEEELSTWTDICTGVYATFGDSLPIEGLTEAANETAKVGAVTGPLADALNWAGVSEDEFNESLAECTSEQERQILIASTLNDLYKDASDTYKEVNKDILEANEAQDKLNSAMAGIGAIAEPVVSQFKSLFADFLTQSTPMLQQLADDLLPPLMDFITQMMPMLFDLLGAIMPIVVDIAGTVLPMFVEILQLLLPPLLQIVQAILPVVTTLLNALMPILQLLIDLLTPIIQLFMDLLTPIIDIIVRAITPLIQIIGVLIELTLEPLINVVKLVGTIFGGTLKGVLDTASKIINNVIGVFKGFSTFLNGVFTGDFTMAFQGIVDIASNIFGGIVEVVKSPINYMIDLLNGFIDGINQIEIPDWVPSVGGKSLSIGHINKLYNGGTTGSGQLISTNEREPEIVGNYGTRTLVINNAQIIDTMVNAISNTMEMYIDKLNSTLTGSNDFQGDIILQLNLGNEIMEWTISNAKLRAAKRSGGKALV